MVPEWTQAERLAKIRYHKDNPNWKGSLGCQLPALDALGSDTVHATFDPVPEIGAMFDESFMVTALNIEGDVSAVGLGISSLSASTYAWDPALEESPKPTTPQTIARVNAIAAPTGVSVVADRRVVAGGSTAVWGVLSWAASPRPDVTVEPSYRLLSATEANFRPMATRQNELSAEAGPLTDTEGYVFRVRFRSGGQVSDWSEVVTLTATAGRHGPLRPNLHLRSPDRHSCPPHLPAVTFSQRAHDRTPPRGRIWQGGSGRHSHPSGGVWPEPIRRL